MRATARLGGLVSAIVLGSMLVSPPGYAARSLTVECTARSGSIAYPSGTATLVAVITFSDGGEPLRVEETGAPGRAGSAPIFNGLAADMVFVEVSALSNGGKVLATGSATCSSA